MSKRILTFELENCTLELMAAVKETLKVMGVDTKEVFKYSSSLELHTEELSMEDVDTD